MSHFLDINQLAEVCKELKLHEAEKALIAVAAVAGKAIADNLGILVDVKASNEPGFGGLCVGFGPAREGQKCPTVIREYDKDSDWAEETT